MTTLIEPECEPIAEANDDVHILDPEANPTDSLVWEVLCGEQCFAWDDGNIDPPGFDFVLVGFGHERATCADCRRKAGLS